MTLEGAAAVIFDTRNRLLLIRENYDRHRYGFPGGAVEAGETPEQAAIRETLEETCVSVEVHDQIGLYQLVSGLAVHLFRCGIVAGEPAVPATGEIAEVAWYGVDALPRPVTNILHHSLADVVAGRTGVVRENLVRIN